MSSPFPKRPSDAASAAAARLEAARAARTRRGQPQDLSRIMLVQVPEVRRMRRQLAGIAAAWAEVVPAPLSERVRLEGVTSGVLNVRAADAAVRFELDRFLRSGGERELLRRFPMAIRRIRIGIEPVSGTRSG
jgi:hypothetical protein